MATGSIRTSAHPPEPPTTRAAASFTGLPLVRRLTRMGETDIAPAAETPFAERVGKWLHWTDAAALFDVLDGPVPVQGPPVGAALDELAQALQRTRESITRSIEADCAAMGGDGDDAKAWQRRVVGRLNAIQTTLTPLRERLRAALAARSPACARLAQVDAVMERVLGARERALLGAMLPSVLQRHADRLRADATAPVGADALPATDPVVVAETPDDWHTPFRRELQAVMTDALDLSLQPLDGLLSALRAAASTDPR